ncbi:MAG: hypothetical protein MI725_13940 [Pirellulales bacterium]|nr:hypothetical protein [Pirellulales bacterium]
MYYDGKYHMIYQWGETKRHGGYATSRDLLHWVDRGVALIPQGSFPPEACSLTVSSSPSHPTMPDLVYTRRAVLSGWCRCN